MNKSKILKSRMKGQSSKNIIVATIWICFFAIHIFGCGNNTDKNNAEYKKIDGRVEPFTHQTLSGPLVTLGLKKEVHLPFLEVMAQFSPPFELPRRLQGGTIRFFVQSVRTQSDLDIYDKDHVMEKNRLANVIWLNFEESKGLWSGNRQVYLSEFRTIPLKNISGVEGKLVLKLPVDPVSVEFNLKDYGGRYEIKDVRFEIEHLSSNKVEILILGSDENYLGMDALVKGKWLKTLGRGSSYTKTSHDQIVTEEHRVSVSFPQRVKAIKLYFCQGYTKIESDIRISSDSLFTKNLGNSGGV